MNLAKVKALVLDVDGVINGSLKCVNTPFPSNLVVGALQDFRKSGGNVVLCTSKGIYPIVEIVKKFELGGVHIADAGGIIFDAGNNEYTIESIPSNLVLKVINLLEGTNNYFEIYSEDNWYISDKFDNHYIKSHSELLRKLPLRLKSFSNFKKQVSKFLYFSEEDVQASNNQELVKLLSELDTKWTVSPVLSPANLLVITNKGISKQTALQKISKNYSIDLNYALGVGDHHSDWKFMSLCRYKGIMGNSTEELIDLAEKEDPSFVSIGKSVDEDGLLDILGKFNVLGN